MLKAYSKWLLLFLISLSGSAYGIICEDYHDNREEKIESLYASQISDWLEASETIWLEGIAYQGKPVRLRAKRFLQDEARANVFIIHGMGERIEKYYELIYDFYCQGYNVFIYDQRGFGESTRFPIEHKQSVYIDRFSRLVDDARSVLKNFLIPASNGLPIFLFAHSMGGGVAGFLAASNSDDISAMVASSPMFEISTLGLPNSISYVVLSILDLLGFGESYGLGQKPPYSWSLEEVQTTSRARWKVYSDFQSQDSIKEQVQGGGTNHFAKEVVGSSLIFQKELFQKTFKMPLLLLTAGRDSLVQVEGLSSFCKHAQDCKEIYFEEAKHEIYREKDTIRVPALDAIINFYEGKLKDGR